MSNLLRLIGRRLIALPIMILGVTFLVFFIMSFSPADPARLALGETASLEALEEYRETHGLNDPLLMRYYHFLVDMLHGDLGTTTGSASVTDVVAKAFPITLQLTFLGLILAAVFSLVFGVIAALYRDKWPDQLIRVVSIAALATPSFWLAILLIQWLGTIPGAWGLFPALITSWVKFTEDPGVYLNNLFLPAVALAVPVAGSLTRVVRTAMVEELDKDYVRTAIGSGIPKAEVISRNVLRNALITPITVLGLRVGYLMGGAVIIEIIFNIQAMGQLILDGVTRNDVYLVQGVTLTVAITFIIINIIVDMLYVLVNPRIRSI
ncbi:ABC transporter permease [Corynebacterium pseudotuberculosis]|uniref:ABC transporter permease subunit n=1 Tax=Corynebacterium pseudotuberculosis (strain C231) TaxID=681645 RepID=D9QDC3_CORP2|nr:ABC transporter permease [Corynebacterium pseudotuberculosis]ADL11508.1 ABC transporter permease subunit [Corynebacterium pseudotuberculosis C231]ADL21921.1 ABC transporter permease [Corynebacterium pseudotuberculosis 1002]ADO27318.1 ABC transporter permease subunit [Corynebacterium pseudotuberculosis I19]AEK93378.1 Oligopeptide transport system permease protein oppB [Corynebacterium pseudotuberculosis PAT10]AEP71284.1 Oligopeptide transport system permease protein oppB [Corynebacterium pse